MDEKMNKRPSLQFYPADWLKAVDLQMCSMNTIGIWINLLCRMWEAKEEGILIGKPGELALLVGAKPGEFKRFLKEAGSHNFCDVLHNVTDCYAIVTIKCRRMNKVFLERERVKLAMRDKRLRESDVPSSSSSSTTKKHKGEIPYNLNEPNFLKAWEDWQKHRTETRHSLTPTTIGRQLKMLAKFPAARAVEIIETSIENGWQGLFPDRISKKPKETPSNFGR